MRRVVFCVVIPGAAALFVPPIADAQVAIAGVVKDGSGAVLPRVAVEAASPALIEKTRTVVSDGAGQYKIVDLLPGIYQVTFTLPGFKSVRRGDVILEGTFTAQVNADLQVGTMEETVTVTAASPSVDVINNTTTFVANRDVLDSIPTPIRNTPARALLIPGTTVTPFVLGQYNMSVHRSNTSDMVIDQRVEEPAGNPARPLHPVRYADELLIQQCRFFDRRGGRSAATATSRRAARRRH